jgi:hypothetical protein
VISPPTPVSVDVSRASVTLDYNTIAEAEEAYREITKTFARREANKKDEA